MRLTKNNWYPQNDKYLKYKSKYLQLKLQIQQDGPRNVKIPNEITNHTNLNINDNDKIILVKDILKLLPTKNITNFDSLGRQINNSLDDDNK